MIAENYIKVFSDLREAERKLTKTTGESFCKYTHLITPLPDWTNREYKYKEHTVNLFELSCTCNDYKRLSEDYMPRDVRRICSHIFIKIKNTKAKEHVDKLTYALMEASAVFGEVDRYITQLEDHPVILGYRPGCHWINLYTTLPKYFDLSRQQEEKFYKYSFNTKEKRWAYSTAPYCEGKVRRVFESFSQHIINRL